MSIVVTNTKDESRTLGVGDLESGKLYKFAGAKASTVYMKASPGEELVWFETSRMGVYQSNDNKDTDLFVLAAPGTTVVLTEE